MTVEVPAALYELIRRFEGCRLTAYRCPAGVWTCGFGATGPDIGPSTVWTLAQATERMRADARRFMAGTAAMCPGLEGDRLEAIADFAFNLGLTRLRGSTLRRRVLAQDWAAAGVELRKWVRGGGRTLPGLVLRRAAEVSLMVQAGRVSSASMMGGPAAGDRFGAIVSGQEFSVRRQMWEQVAKRRHQVALVWETISELRLYMVSCGSA